MNNLYTQEEFKELCNFVSTIKDWIPEDKASYVWNNYKKISGSIEQQPCNCGSSAGLWRKAMETIRNFVKENA